MDFKDNKFLLIIAVFIAFLVGIVVYPNYSGLVLICSIIAFGLLSIIWKESKFKIESMVLLVILATANILLNGVHFGIDFSGGTRIPILLEKSVDQNTMTDMVNAIKTRVSVLGLTEVKVRSIGDSEINVELPSSDERTIQFIEQTLSKQGVYQGIIDGKIAVSGEHIFASTIRQVSAVELAQDNSGGDWGVAFTVNREGAELFAKVAKGKYQYPIYMFLDRPTDAVIFYESEQLSSIAKSTNASNRELLRTLNRTLRLEADRDIEVYVIDDANLTNITPKTNKTKAVISSNTSRENKDKISRLGFVLSEVDPIKMQPELGRNQNGELLVSKFEAVGLLSAPILGAQVTTGVPNYGYQVTGPAVGLTDVEKNADAIAKGKELVSILKGGSLPVQISVGSRTILPSALGNEFLKLSIIGVVSALTLIGIFIGLRYRNLSIAMPIILISLGELVILVSILGSFTVDLAAVAGILAAIGVSVDAQIVITDEIIKKDEEHTIAEKVGLAFGIIKTNAIVAIFSMVPLLFSGLVEVIGFAISTILGALLGYVLTRPTYAALFEQMIAKNQEKTG